MLKVKIWLWIWLWKNLYGYGKVSTKLLYAQTYHETGDFKSKVFKENKNLFGMREAKVRKTYNTGSNLKHATYKSHLDSIRDYFERQKYFGIPDEKDAAYIRATVKSNYAEDEKYAEKWEAIAERIKMPVNNLFLIGTLFFLVLIAVILYKKR